MLSTKVLVIADFAIRKADHIISVSQGLELSVGALMSQHFIERLGYLSAAFKLYGVIILGCIVIPARLIEARFIAVHHR
jgi:hypothetical protein